MGKRAWFAVYALIIVCALGVSFFRLGSTPFWDYDEATYANIMQDAVHRGDVLTMHLGDDVWFEKPPLFFWAGMATRSVFGHAEFSYRAPAALAGVIGIALVMLITYELGGSFAGAAFAGLMLFTTGAFLAAGREARLDLPAIAAVLFTVYAFIKGARNPRWLLWVGVGAGVGFMFKSVIGLLAAPFILIWALVYRDWRWLKSRWLWIGAGVGFLIVAPWHMYETIRYGYDFWHSYLLHHVLDRFTGDVIGQSASRTNYFNFFLTFAAPWTTAFLIWVVYLMTQGKKMFADAMRPALVCTLAALTILALFFFAGTRIYYYLLPSYPFVVLALALGVTPLLKQGIERFRYGLYAVGVVLLTLTGFGAWVTINYTYHLFPIAAINDLIVREEREVAEKLNERPIVPVYTYEYENWETIPYYRGSRERTLVEEGTALDRPLFLIMPLPLADNVTFPVEIQAHLTEVYRGITIVLYYFEP